VIVDPSWIAHPGSQQLFLSSPVFETLYEGTRGPGKGLPLDEPVMCPMGNRRIGDLKVHDRVCSPDGTEATVIGVFPQGKRETYEIEFDDGAVARCDDVHIWPVNVQGQGNKRGLPYTLASMAEVSRQFRAGHRVHIPTLQRLEMRQHPRVSMLPVDPYLLGLLLGDGCFTQGRVYYCTADDELADYVLAAGAREGPRDGRNGLRYFGLNPLKPKIKSLRLKNTDSGTKFVPNCYKIAPSDVRLAVLQGLLDTDGTVDRGGYVSFSSKSKQLAEDVQWLARSLGAKATLTRKYVVYIQAASKFIPFRLKRKVARVRGYQHPTLQRRITAIRPLGKQETVCIKVDHPLGLFITRDFVVTHNTDALLMDFAQHVGLGYGDYWRGVLFRQTYKQLSDVIAKSKRWYKRLFPGAEFNAGSYTWHFPGGEELLLRHMKVASDYDNYHGHEYPWIGWEELTNWATSECYDLMKSCSRSSIPYMPRKYRATCNPFGVGHNWVKATFIDPAPRGTIIRVGKEPPRVAIHGNLMENSTMLSADPEYREKLAAIKSLPKRRAWLFGDWNITSGGMFDEVWDADTHLIPPFDIPRHWKIDRSFDWGSSAPFSVGWWAEADGGPVKLADGTTRHFPAGTLFRLSEWYGWNGEPNVGSRMLANRIAEKIVEKEKSMSIYDRCDAGPADSSIWDEVNGNCIARDMAEKGVDWVPANKGPGSRKNGWELLRVRLNNCLPDTDKPELRGMMEDPGLFVFDRSLAKHPTKFGDNEQFKRTFPYLPRDPVDMDDVDTTSEDHVGDETRYRALHSVPSVTQVDMYHGKKH